MNLKNTAIMLTAVCGLIGTHAYAIDAEVDNAIAEAEAAIEKADSVGFAWRDSGKILKSARAAAADGEREQALELAAQAKFQGEAGYAQYEANKDAGPTF